MLRRIAVIGLVAAVATGAARAQPAPPVDHRQIIRGVPAPPEESPELRALRRFEESAFERGARGPRPRVLDDDEPGQLPPGLAGQWSGSGDAETPGRTTPPRSDAPARPPPPAWLASLRLPELPVRWEPSVMRFLEFFKSSPDGRSIMTGWLRRRARYQATFERIFAREGVPKDLIFLAMIESGFDPGATSPVGAGGIWQFMPSAARAYGLEVSHWVDARRDPERAAEAASRYLKDLYTRFGSWPLAFAAYHAGYAAILASITRFNSNDYWELCRHEAGLPWETTLYVPKILAVAIIGHNLEAFGFAQVALDPPWEYETVEVPPGTRLAAVARAAGVEQQTVESLNPEYVRGRAPPDRGPVAVRVPVGAAATYARAAGRPGPEEALETVVLRFGESLDDLARARGVTTRDLRRLNGVRTNAELRAGTTLLVPARAAARVAAPPAAPADDAIIVAVPERVFEYPDRDRVFYRARDGDRIEEIAEILQVAADDLCEWNAVDPAAKLQPGQVLQAFVRKEFDPGAKVALLDPAKLRVVTLGSEEFSALSAAQRGKTRLRYTAKAGDTLAKIARRYGLAPGDLARINKFSSATELKEGQSVIVYSPTPDLPREVLAGRSGAGARAARAGARAGAAPARGAPAAARPTVAATGKNAKAPAAAPGKPTPAPGAAATRVADKAAPGPARK